MKTENLSVDGQISENIKKLDGAAGRLLATAVLDPTVKEAMEMVRDASMQLGDLAFNLEQAEDKAARIKKEVKRLSGIFTKLDGRQKKAVQSLISNAAFMAVTLQELQETMNRDGVISEYQNGENQWGTKKSPEVEIYNTMVKNHAAIMKQLTDLLPPPAPPEEKKDALDEHIRSRPD